MRIVCRAAVVVTLIIINIMLVIILSHLDPRILKLFTKLLITSNVKWKWNTARLTTKTQYMYKQIKSAQTQK